MRRRNFLKSHHARKYDSRRFKNPYAKKQKRSWNGILKMSLIALIVFVGIPFALFKLPFFYTNSITVEGSITLQPTHIESFVDSELQSKRWNVVPQNHIWFINEASLREKILNEFALDNATVTRNGRSVHVLVEERITSLIWASGEVLYFVDQNGLVVRELSEDELNDVRSLLYGEGERTFVIQSDDVFIVFEQSGGDVSQNGKVLYEEGVETLSVINAEIGRYLIEIESIESEHALSDWVTLNIRGGLDIYLSLEADPYDQLANLEVVLDEYQGGVGDIEYIDLRFGNRVFVK